MEDKIFECVVFDQDCFHDVRKYAANQRQRQWICEYLPELQEISKSHVLYRRLETSFPKDTITPMSKFDKEILKKLSIANIIILGSSQDGLYLEKGFPIIKSNDRSEVNSTDLDILLEYSGIDIKQSRVGIEPKSDIKRTGNENKPPTELKQTETENKPPTDTKQTGTEPTTETYLLITKTKYHGYVNLRIISPELEEAPCPIFFKAKTLKWQLLFHLDLANFYVSKNVDGVIGESPAIGGAIEDELGIYFMDYVVGLKMKEWPKIAETFITREKSSGWPGEDLVKEIIQEGCGFVSTGHNFCKDDEFQWRISFASSEQILIRSLNRVQIRSYLFFKTICKIHFTDYESFSSYMLKNILFWTIEILPLDIWEESNICYCVESLVDMLCNFIDQKIIPNFFLSSLNLTGHIEEDEICEWAEKAHDIQNDIVGIFIKCVEETKDQTVHSEEPTFQGHCEVSLPLLHLKLMTSPENEASAILSLTHFSTYLFLRIQRQRYQLKLLPQTVNECFFNRCHSISEVIPQRAAWYLVRALQMQPDPTSLTFCSKNGAFEFDLSGFRKAVVSFWRSPLYTGIFKNVIVDHEHVSGETVDIIPEFNIFLEWVDFTCMFSGCEGIIPTNQTAALD